jgi:hypothetical protein
VLHGFGHVLHGFAQGEHGHGIDQPQIQLDSDWNIPHGAAHGAHGAHGFAHGAAHGFAHVLQPQPANAGAVNITATATTNTNNAIFFIVIPPSGYDDYNCPKSIHSNIQIGKFICFPPS